VPQPTATSSTPAQTSPAVKTATSQNTQTVTQHPQVVNNANTQTVTHQAQHLSSESVQAKAAELLRIPREQVQVPAEIYAEATGTETLNRIKKDYLDRRQALLEELAAGKKIFASWDCDGTITSKTVLKVENTRSIGSKHDVHYLRTLVKGVAKAGGRFEVNTARTGPIAGPSLVGTEGPKFMCKDGKFHNPRIASEISSVLNEFGIYNLNEAENQKIYNALTINGLSGAVTHNPAQPLKVREAVDRYGDLINMMNSVKVPGYEEGFLAELEKIVANKKEANPLRVLEYKAIPEAFRKNPKLSVDQYLAYIDLVKKSRAEKWDSLKFATELTNSGLKTAIDPQNTLDESDSAAEAKLTAAARKGFIACLTPHALDAYGIIRDDIKRKMYKLLADFSRAPEVKAWAKQKYGIDENQSLFTINGKSVDHLNFEDKAVVNLETGHAHEDLNSLIQELKEQGREATNKNSILIDIKDNHPQPYLEMAPNTTKDEVLPAQEKVTKDNLLVIGAGDSPSTDSFSLAQSVLLGGFAYIVRGLMGPETICDKMVELLAKPQNSHHAYALKDLGNQNYQLIAEADGIAAGTTLSKSQWSAKLLEKYKSRIFRADNIHQMNAMNASIFAELFRNDPSFNLKLDENAKWVQDALKMNNKSDLATPDCGTQDRIAGEVYEPQAIAIEKVGPWMRKAMNVIAYAMQGAGIFGIGAKLLGQQHLAQIAKRIQSFFLGANNIISGVTRGLIAPAVRYPWQFIGEMIGLYSTTFDKSSVIGQTFRALSNVTLIGRANELIMRENNNLDKFADDKATKDELTKTFGSEHNHHKDIKHEAAKLTKERMKFADGMEDLFGANFLRKKLGAPGRAIAGCIRFCSEAAADLWQGGRMLIQTLSIPAYGKYMLSNFFGSKGKGMTRLSQNSGRPYNSPFSPAHHYATLGFATAATSIISGIVGKFSKTAGQALTSLANIIPTLGIVTTGKHIMQDAAGDPRRFTTIAGKQERYSPEKAGTTQARGGWLQAIGAMFLGTDIGQLLFDVGTGTYLHGVNEELKVRNDDSAVNKLSRAGTYFRHEDDELKVPNAKNQLKH